MSCDTNEKSIDLPPSINLLTPFEPLTEEDDIRRLDSCEAIEEGAEEAKECLAEECEADWGRDRELVESEDHPAAFESSATGAPAGVIPKLSIIMPSSHVLGLSDLLLALYSKPTTGSGYASGTLKQRSKTVRRVAEEKFQFFQPVSEDDDNEERTKTSKRFWIMDELQRKEDWFVFW
jgi:hypothetical protein